MIAPTADELDAIKRVAARPEGIAIQAYLQKNMDEFFKRLPLTEDAVKLRVLQGQTQVVQSLLAVWKP